MASPGDRADVAPMKLEDLRKIRLIKEGRMSSVWFVKNRHTGTAYALKEIPLQHITTDKQAHNIWNERRALEEFTKDHVEGIVRLEATFKDERSLYFLLELCVGGPIHHHIRKSGGLSVSRATFYVAELVNALEQVHVRGYIYRDLKASNVTLSDEGHVKLIDFGFVRRLSKGERAYTLCGTYHAMAPEMHTLRHNNHQVSKEYESGDGTPSVAKSAGDPCTIGSSSPCCPRAAAKDGVPGYGFAVDWWALGVLTYEMVHSAAPFGYQDFDDNRNQTIYDLALTSPLSLKFESHSLPDDFRDFVSSLLQADENQRLGTHGGASEVKSHPFFKNFDWSSIHDPFAVPEMDPFLRIDLDEEKSQCNSDPSELGPQGDSDPFSDF